MIIKDKTKLQKKCSPVSIEEGEKLEVKEEEEEETEKDEKPKRKGLMEA